MVEIVTVLYFIELNISQEWHSKQKLLTENFKLKNSDISLVAEQWTMMGVIIFFVKSFPSFNERPCITISTKNMFRFITVML